MFKKENTATPEVMPKGTLKQLYPEEIQPSRDNPRLLFDEEPLAALRDSIRDKGVLVPITVYPLKGQDKYGILDGERRYRCCMDLQKEGLRRKIPANVVDPPTKLAFLLYMFNIHQFRQQWELMPTALSLQIVMEELNETDSKRLSKLTGLSEPQIERCKKLLLFPKHFQLMSLDTDPKKRIPSNFWIEALPVLDLVKEILPDVYETLGRDTVTQKFVDKYNNRKLRSVIHFRKIVEAYSFATDAREQNNVRERLRSYLLNPDLETREAFDEFVLSNKRIQDAIARSEEYVEQLRRLRLQFATEEKEKLLAALNDVQSYISYLIDRIRGVEAPVSTDEEEQQV